MPRMNLTEAEAEAIRQQRQYAREHATTWNAALDAACEAIAGLSMPSGQSISILQKDKIQNALIELRRKPPSEKETKS